MIAFLLAAAFAAPPAEAARADQFWVILGSKRDPNEEIPGLRTLAAHPEVKAQVERLPSSRFKNLMPCYTVTVAGASADKRVALELSKALRGIGVDNYVKNAGAYVGPNPALDAWCAQGEPEARGLVLRGEAAGAFLPIDLPAETTATLLQQAAAPKVFQADVATWYGELPVQKVGAHKLDDAIAVRDLTTGAVTSCTISSFGAATLGVPHFGWREAPMSTPGCGSPRIVASLRCELSPGRPFAVSKPGQTVWKELGPGPASALKALDAHPIWKERPLADEERSTKVLRYGLNGKELHLVIGHRSTEGGACGGVEQTLAGLFTPTGEAVWPIRPLEVTEVLGVADLEGDGKPELVLSVFPASTVVMRASGEAAATAEMAYCDCPC